MTADRHPETPDRRADRRTGYTARCAAGSAHNKIADLDKRITGEEGLPLEILNIRLDLAWLGLLEQTLAFAEAVVASEEDGFDVSGLYRRCHRGT